MSKSLVRRKDPVRAMAIVAQNDLIASVSHFAEYTDPTGARASSPKGLAISINSAIKRYYGMPRSDMPRGMLLHVSSVLVRVVEWIEQGIQEERTRDEIKRGIRGLLREGGESYTSLMEVRHD